MIKKSIATLVVIAAVIAASAAALQITRQDNHSSDKLAVTASFYPLYDFASQVGGDKVDVMNMTPAGAEPHDYEPSPQALIRAHESKIFIYNGGSMEPWVDSFLGDYQHTVVKASDGIGLREIGGSHDHDHDHGHDEHGVKDPHFWLDPVLAQQIVDSIRDGLSQADPDNQQYYDENDESSVRSKSI